MINVKRIRDLDLPFLLQENVYGFPALL